MCHTLTTADQFETTLITVKLGTLKQTAEVHRKLIMDWIKEVLQDPYLYHYVHWYPERVFVLHGDGRWIQHIDEP